LFDRNGGMRGLGRVRVETRSPAPGRVELAVEDFWALLRRGLAEALAQAGATAGDISGVSYSSQATTLVLLDRRDRPLTPFIVWTDRRGDPIEPAIAAFARQPRFQQAIGHTGFAAESAVPKLRWFMRHEPRIWAEAARVMTLADYFTFALTGERVGDASTAAFLGLYHLGERRWWQEALAAFGIEAGRLSTPLRPGAACGRTGAAAPACLGVPAGIPFAVGAIDHHAAAIGSGLGRLADLSISTGTVLAALAIVDDVVPVEGCYHGPHTDGVRYYRLAFDPHGAGELEDYQRRQAPGLTIERLLELAAQTPAGARPATAECNTPSDTDHGRAVRAVLERVAATHRRLVETTAGGRRVGRVIATGGGARSPLWLQIEADMLDARIVRPASPERACLGAAAFAAVAAGLHASLATATAAMVHPDLEIAPIPAHVAIYGDRNSPRGG
jgi:xylulokinase